MARSSRLSAAPEEASTIRTLGGRRWRNSSRRRGPSVVAALSSSQLLHPAEELRGPTIAQLHGVEELL